MADNVTLDSMSGGDTVAADEIGGVKFQRVKIVEGADGVNDGDVASGNPLPVDIISALPAGTNAIGKLGPNSGVDIGDVDILTAPNRDRTTDNQGVAQQTDALMDDTTVLTPKFASISASSSGDNTLVSAVAGKKIRVVDIFFVCAAAVTVRLEDGAGGSALTGQMEFAANSGMGPPFNPLGHFETSSNTLLNMELSAAVWVAGYLQYVEV